ncbi:predicted protein, partial [Nematostella vectensis]
FTNSWAVELDSDDEELAKEVARKHGFKYAGRIGELPGHFHLYRDEHDGEDSKRGGIVYPELKEHPNVKWHEQQRTLSLHKRSLSVKRVVPNFYNDPMLQDQWYLKSFGRNGVPMNNDMKVMDAWADGYTGKGIVVTVMDDGLDHTNDDLKHYDPKASLNLNGATNGDTTGKDPIPRDEPDQYHGTKCAGEIGAKSNNGFCGVGVAPDVNLGAIRMLDGKVTGMTEGHAFSHNPQYVDIYSASWGPKDNGKTLAGPSSLGRKALEHGVKRGRNGKGSLYVWASGNGGASSDDCNCDGYTSSIYTIAVGSVSAAGGSTFYDEKCPSTLAVVYSGDSDLSRTKLGGNHKLVTTGPHNSCVEHFGGTSAAAPLAAGVVALTLQANPELTWRDMQHLITRSTDQLQKDDPSWKRNAAGFLVSNKFGFGLLNAHKLTTNALKWKRVPDQKRCEIEGPIPPVPLIKRNKEVVLRVRTNGCEGSENAIKRLEHVQAIITLAHRKRGVLSIDIRSPRKTASRLLSTRPLDESASGIKNWPFMTVQMWGEDPKGEWEVVIRDN